jgi:hypothetical protein
MSVRIYARINGEQIYSNGQSSVHASTFIANKNVEKN